MEAEYELRPRAHTLKSLLHVLCSCLRGNGVQALSSKNHRRDSSHKMEFQSLLASLLKLCCAEYWGAGLDLSDPLIPSSLNSTLVETGLYLPGKRRVFGT